MQKIRVAISILIYLLWFNFAVAQSGFIPETGRINSERWNNGVSLGGIGCGKLEILTDGAFANVTINNNWDRRTGIVKGTFFAIHTDNGKKKTTRLLRLSKDKIVPTTAEVEKLHNKLLGLSDDEEFTNVQNIQKTEYFGTFPTLRIKYGDEELPIDLELSAWSPLIPNNIKESSLPVALFSFTINNPNPEEVDISLLFSWQNILGFGGHREIHWDCFDGNKQVLCDTQSLMGIQFTTEQKYDTQQQNTIGEYFIGTEKSSENVVEYCESWDAGEKEISWWSEFCQTGTIVSSKIKEESKPAQPAGVIIVRKKLKPKEKQIIEFIASWYMPYCVTKYIKKTPTEDLEENNVDVLQAFDKDPNSRWTTERKMLAGDTYLLDLGEGRQITKLVLDTQRSPNNYPRGCEIKASLDGKQWVLVKKLSELEVEKTQRNGLLTINLSSLSKDVERHLCHNYQRDKSRVTKEGEKLFPIQARYLKIVQSTTMPDYQWSIYELFVYELISNKESEIKPVSATAYLVKQKEEIIQEDVSHYYTNFFDDAQSIAEYVFQRRKELLAQTEEWQNLVWKSNLPFWLKLKLINCAFPIFSNSIFTKDGRYSTMESPVSMAGAMGTSDQRMSAHAFLNLFFPELDEKELELFAQCQDLVEPIPDGRIPHFTGNINEIIGNPNVTSGVRNWPDLTCSWVMQVVKYYRLTGDKEFLGRQWSHIKRAMEWLKNADHDGDAIPEGGSTYDYEHPKGGAFCYTASCYLGALKSAIEAARTMNDSEKLKEYKKQFKLVQKNVIKYLWNGKYFIKNNNILTGEKNPNCFIAQLAGDWLSQLSGLGTTIHKDMRQLAVREILERNVKPFYPIPAMEVTPEGKVAVDSSYIIQNEPYIGMEAIYAGYVDDGLEVIKRVYDTVWLVNKDPWHQALWYDIKTSARKGLVYYMTCPATWHIFNALSGTTLNLSEETLWISPKLPSYINEWHIPIFFPKFWLWMDYVSKDKKLTISVVRTFGDKEWIISKIIGIQSSRPIKLKNKFIIKENATLDLSEYINKLVK